jgi:hypothetical protein
LRYRTAICQWSAAPGLQGVADDVDLLEVEADGLKAARVEAACLAGRFCRQLKLGDGGVCQLDGGIDQFLSIDATVTKSEVAEERASFVSCSAGEKFTTFVTGGAVSLEGNASKEIIIRRPFARIRRISENRTCGYTSIKRYPRFASKALRCFCSGLGCRCWRR